MPNADLQGPAMTCLPSSIETRRLELVRPANEHFSAWSEFMADEIAARHLGGPQDASSAWRALATMCGSWCLQGFGMYSVIEKATGAWVGRVGPWRPYGWPGTEIGWGVIRSKWGQGYAFEAAVACIDNAIAHLGWTDIVHLIAPDNERSQALAKRLGAENCGPGALPGALSVHPVEIWRQSADQWISRRPALEASLK